MYLERLLLHNELFFTRRTNLNDPFDCKLPPHSFDSTDAEALDWAEKFVDRKFAGLPQKDRGQRVVEILKKMPTPEFIAGLKKDLQEQVDTCGLLCLSARWDVPLMWAHYANKHTGVCLRFDAADSAFAEMLQVRYYADPPAVNVVRDTMNDQVKAVFVSKDECWAYEEEWRVVDPHDGPGIHTIPVSLLTGLVFGSRANKKQKERVAEWAEERGDQNGPPGRLELFRAVEKDGSFKLEIVPWMHTPV
jgi:hypothetical protein